MKPKTNLHFLIYDKQIFVSVESLLCEFQETDDRDILLNIKHQVHNIQNSEDGLPTTNDFTINEITKE